MYFRYRVTLYFYTMRLLCEVWFITAPLYWTPPNGLFSWFCCIQYRSFLNSRGLCSALVHFSGFRVSTLQVGLSSKDNAEFIIIWGNFKFTTKVANEIAAAKKRRDFPSTHAKYIWNIRTRKCCHMTRKCSIFFKEPYCWAECLKSHFNHIL